MNRVDRQVVLVDQDDNQVGLMEIWQAHQNPGVLHRAVSALVINQDKQILLQQRSGSKPLWPLFWSNSFCTHPFPGEPYLDCLVRRGREEMGLELDVANAKLIYKLVYQADYNSQLSEHESTAVMLVTYSGDVVPNPKEAADYRWVSWVKLQTQIKDDPDVFTPWFKLILKDPHIIGLFE